MDKNKLLFFATLGQTLIVLLYTFSIFIFKDYMELKNSLILINTIVLMFTVLILVSLKNLAEIIKREVEYDNMKSEIKNTESLINIFRQQRHDHINFQLVI